MPVSDPEPKGQWLWRAVVGGVVLALLTWAGVSIRNLLVEPLEVVERYGRTEVTNCLTYWVNNSDPGPVPTPVDLSADGESSWAESSGATPIASSGLELQISGVDDKAVVLRSATVVVDSSVELPPIRTTYNITNGCGGSLSPRYFDVDPSSAQPALIAQPGREESYEDLPPVDFPFRVSASDPELFLINVQCTGPADVVWHLELNWAKGRRSGSSPLQKHRILCADPDRASADRGASSYQLAGERWSLTTP